MILRPDNLKKTNLIIAVVAFLSTGMSYFVSAQEKLEKEFRLPQKEVPLKAISFVDSLQLKSKIKWYKEEGLTEESIEAKTKYNGIKYSIEFNTEGELQDIEIETQWDLISESVRKNIRTYLNSSFSTHNICKIQQQYSGKNKDLIEIIARGKKNAPHRIKYEIVLKGKNAEGKHLYEFLFSNDGSFEKMSKIIFRSTDNMEF